MSANHGHDNHKTTICLNITIYMKELWMTLFGSKLVFFETVFCPLLGSAWVGAMGVLGGVEVPANVHLAIMKSWSELTPAIMAATLIRSCHSHCSLVMVMSPTTPCKPETLSSPSTFIVSSNSGAPPVHCASSAPTPSGTAPG